MNAKQEFFPITVSAAHTVKEERKFLHANTKTEIRLQVTAIPPPI